MLRMRAHVDMQDRAMRVPQGRLRLCVMLMSGVVCQRHAPDLTGRDAEQRESIGDGEAQALAGKSEGGTTEDTADNTDATGEGCDKKERGRQGIAVYSTYEDKRHIAERSRQPFDCNGG